MMSGFCAEFAQDYDRLAVIDQEHGELLGEGEVLRIDLGAADEDAYAVDPDVRFDLPDELELAGYGVLKGFRLPEYL